MPVSSLLSLTETADRSRRRSDASDSHHYERIKGETIAGIVHPRLFSNVLLRQAEDLGATPMSRRRAQAPGTSCPERRRA